MARIPNSFPVRLEAQVPELTACDNLSLDRVAGLAQALGLGIDETRRLLAANQPEDWQA